jgi:hypothetical protein
MLTTKIFNYLQILILSFLIQNGAYAISASDEEEIISVVSAQLQAFQDDDFEKAYSYASPTIKTIFPDYKKFRDMVVGQYQAVYRPKSINIGSVSTEGGVPFLEVYLVDPDGIFVTAIYSMQQQENGSWLINGCFLSQAQSDQI